MRCVSLVVLVLSSREFSPPPPLPLCLTDYSPPLVTVLVASTPIPEPIPVPVPVLDALEVDVRSLCWLSS